jgi:hypothetical protein
MVPIFEQMPETSSPSRPTDFAFLEPMRVRWSDCDMQGIVFNPNYLVYADNAMTEYMRAVGFPYPEALLSFGADIFAAGLQIDSRARRGSTTCCVQAHASSASGGRVFASHIGFPRR